MNFITTINGEERYAPGTKGNTSSCSPFSPPGSLGRGAVQATISLPEQAYNNQEGGSQQSTLSEGEYANYAS